MAEKKAGTKGGKSGGGTAKKARKKSQKQVPEGTAQLLALEPGTNLTVDFLAGPEQLPCTLLGFLENNSIMVRLPLVAGIDQATEEGARVKVRFVHQSAVHGFESSVQGRYVKGPLRFIFLAYPQAIEQFNLRRHIRVSCYIPATAEVRGRVLQGVIVDLSPGGARYASFADEREPFPMVDVNDDLALGGHVEGREVFKQLSCKVRSVSKDDRRMLLGLAFADQQSEAVEMIGAYVTKMARLIEETEL